MERGEDEGAGGVLISPVSLLSAGNQFTTRGASSGTPRPRVSSRFFLSFLSTTARSVNGSLFTNEFYYATCSRAKLLCSNAFK